MYARYKWYNMTGNIGYILYQKSISDAISGLSIQPRTVKLNPGKCKRGHRNILVSQKNALKMFTWAHRKGIPIWLPKITKIRCLPKITLCLPELYTRTKMLTWAGSRMCRICDRTANWRGINCPEPIRVTTFLAKDIGISEADNDKNKVR